MPKLCSSCGCAPEVADQRSFSCRATWTSIECMTMFRSLLFIAALGSAGQASAQFAVCNQSFDVINVAIGLDVADDFQTEGWWTIGPNQCANVIKDELTSRYIYVYAQDVLGQPITTGTDQMCISPRKFEIRGIGECWSRGHLAADFVEVDTEKTERWTLFFAAAQ